MAIVVLTPPETTSYEIVAIGQWVGDPKGGYPEIAFQVRDDWQGEGLGSYVFRRLMEIAKELGMNKLKADVLSDNKGMNAVFEKSGISFVRSVDFGVYTYIFDLEQIRTENRI